MVYSTSLNTSLATKPPSITIRLLICLCLIILAMNAVPSTIRKNNISTIVFNATHVGNVTHVIEKYRII